MGRHTFDTSQASFLAAARNWTQAPEIGLPEVAVCGRSNVGKSSVVNLLLGRRKIARTSSTPGRTQTLNFFEVGHRLVLVDLPGYGYAKAPKTEALRWLREVKAYLARRAALRAVVLLLDIRRVPSPADLAFCALVRQSGRALLPVVTKADKVPRGHRLPRLKAIAEAIGAEPQDLVVTSAHRGEGRDSLWKRILELTADRGPDEVGTPAQDLPPRDPSPPQAPPLVVAIDGPSGAGKSTVARGAAARLGWNYIDTGAMYRAIGLKADREGVSLDDDPRLDALCRNTALELRRDEDGTLRVFLDGQDVSEAIREHRVSDLASRVSARRPVREAMSRYQRRLGSAAPSVLEGRDIGTVVFPDAQVKIFLTASDEERARRRTLELRARGQTVQREDVLRDLQQRDRNDSTREHAPLKAAPDAHVLDTTGLSVDEVVERVVALASKQERTALCAPGPGSVERDA